MNMFNVLTRLAELDAGNENVVNPMVKKPVAESVPQLPELKDISELRALTGLKPVNECGMMPEAGVLPGAAPSQPASFSINASAKDGNEVANMLTQIMTLAGVKPVSAADMPNIDSGARPPVPGATATTGADDKEVMRGMMDKLNDPNPEDEGTIGQGVGGIAGGALGGAAGTALGTAVGGPIGGAIGGAAGNVLGTAVGSDMGDEITGEEEGDVTGDSPLGAMADEVRDMADELGDTSKEELGLESYDNTPAVATDVPAYNDRALAYDPNSGEDKRVGSANQPRAHTAEDIEKQLFAEYQQFVAEGSTGDYSAKKARAGKDIGKPGKQFAKIAKSAGEKYGSKERGEKVAGAVLAKLRKG